MTDTPPRGFFTLIHHDGPVIEWSDDITERRRVIDRNKPEHERATRHRCIQYIPESMIPALYAAWAEYQLAKGPDCDYELATGIAYAEYERVTGLAYATYKRVLMDRLNDQTVISRILALIPDCPWNGATIFPLEEG